MPKLRLRALLAAAAVAGTVLAYTAAAQQSEPEEQAPPTATSITPASPTFTVPAPADYTLDPDRTGDYTYAWTTEPGVDPASRAAALVRAFEESLTAADIVGPELSFPGYHQAYSASHLPPFGGYVETYSPDGVWQGRLRYRGTFHARILSIETTGHGFRARYCQDRLSTESSLRSGADYQRPSVGLRLRVVEMARVPDQAEQPLPPPTGRRAPAYDVFAGWRVAHTRYQGDRTACVPWQQARYPTARTGRGGHVYLHDGISTAPMVVLPPQPGW